MQRTNAEVPSEVTELLARLRDPEFARVLIVTLAESTPVHEAQRLQDDLERAGIGPLGWVINGSLAAVDTSHPTLRARAASERAHIDRVRGLAPRTWLAGWQPTPPVGPDGLRALAEPRVLSGR
ncbi:MAG TPA: ArsA-related P-loop ATPase [Solirubrobacteraceae bacterium]|nr:ArsA-related P-loop ATPase [Solirubrobacteraceae bacterium]